MVRRWAQLDFFSFDYKMTYSWHGMKRFVEEIFNLQYISSVLTYRGVTPYFENLRNRRLRWIMIRSHESFQESYLKVVKPKTKWDIFKFPPFNTIWAS